MRLYRMRMIEIKIYIIFHNTHQLQFRESVNIQLTLLSLPAINVKVMFLVTRQPLHSFFLLSSVIFANINLQIASRTRDAGVSEICLGYQARRESLGDSPEKPEKIRAARRDEIRGKRVRVTEEERTPGEVREPRETLLSTRNNGTD